MSQENNIDILRTGKSIGNVDRWEDIFKEVSFKVGKINPIQSLEFSGAISEYIVYFLK